MNRSIFTLPPAPDFLALRYRPDLHLLVCRWQRPVSAAELRRGYQAILHAAEAADCRFWQLDMRSCQALDEAAVQGLTAEFLPPLRRLAGPVCLAYLLAPQYPARPAAAHSPRAGTLQVSSFVEEGALTTWLAGRQRHQVAGAGVGFSSPRLAA